MPGSTPLQSYIVNEELGWGSFGLAVQLGVIGMPFALIMGKALLTGETELVDKFLKPFCQCKDASMRGSWAITEVEHGSDLIGSEKEIFSDPNIRWSVQAKQEERNGFSMDRSRPGYRGRLLPIMPCCLPGLIHQRGCRAEVSFSVPWK